MIRVRFRSAEGDDAVVAEAAAGTRLLDLAQGSGLPLEGACEGAMACSTCHVILGAADWAKFPPPGPHEEDMLDFAADVAPTSRLSCQLWLEEGMGEIEVAIPSHRVDLRR
jgi:ferredoxin